MPPNRPLHETTQPYKARRSYARSSLYDYHGAEDLTYQSWKLRDFKSPARNTASQHALNPGIQKRRCTS